MPEMEKPMSETMFRENLTETDLALMTEFAAKAAAVNGSSLEKVSRRMSPSYYRDYLRFSCINTETTIKLSQDGEIWLRTTATDIVDSYNGKCKKQISHKNNGTVETRIVTAPSLSAVSKLIESLL